MVTRKQVDTAIRAHGGVLDVDRNVALYAWLPDDSELVWSATGGLCIAVGHNTGMTLAECYSELLELVGYGVD